MATRTPLRVTFAALALVVFAGGCGGSGSPAPDSTLPPDAGLVVTAVPSIRFDTSTYTVAAGDVKVAYVNNDTVRHTLVVVKDGMKVPNFKLDIAKKGALDVGTVNLAAGEYTLICDVPGHQNMKATLTVN